MRRSARWLLAIFVLAMLLLCVAPLVVIFRLDGPSAQQGQTRAQPLIEALERYKQAHGNYPADLQTLVPAYLENIPKPALRYPYFYTVCTDGSVYILLFRPGGHSDLTPKRWGYSSATRAWKFGDGGAPPYFYETPCLGYGQRVLLYYQSKTGCAQGRII